MSVEITTDELYDRAKQFGLYPKHIAEPRYDFKGDRLTGNHADLIALEAEITKTKLEDVTFYRFSDPIPNPPED